MEMKNQRNIVITLALIAVVGSTLFFNFSSGDPFLPEPTITPSPNSSSTPNPTTPPQSSNPPDLGTGTPTFLTDAGLFAYYQMIPTQNTDGIITGGAQQSPTSVDINIFSNQVYPNTKTDNYIQGTYTIDLRQYHNNQPYPLDINVRIYKNGWVYAWTDKDSMINTPFLIYTQMPYTYNQPYSNYMVNTTSDGQPVREETTLSYAIKEITSTAGFANWYQKNNIKYFDPETNANMMTVFGFATIVNSGNAENHPYTDFNNNLYFTSSNPIVKAYYFYKADNYYNQKDTTYNDGGLSGIIEFKTGHLRWDYTFGWQGVNAEQNSYKLTSLQKNVRYDIHTSMHVVAIYNGYNRYDALSSYQIQNMVLFTKADMSFFNPLTIFGINNSLVVDGETYSWSIPLQHP